MAASVNTASSGHLLAGRRMLILRYHRGRLYVPIAHGIGIFAREEDVDAQYCGAAGFAQVIGINQFGISRDEVEVRHRPR